MRVRQVLLASSAPARSRLLPAASSPGLLCLLLAACCARAGAQSPELPRPTRMLTVSGRVSLEDDRPATRALVKLSGQGGVNRETTTNDNGRFEFTEVPAGLYTVTARSLSDPSLSPDTIEADTSRTSTSTLLVSLTLRDEAVRATRRAGVISAGEAEQRVPKPAREAYQRALKLRREDKPADALASFDRAVELYPEYFQALAARGDLRVARRELAEAAADFDRALKLNARYAPALRGAGYCKLEAKEFGQAADLLERAAAVEPGNSGTQLLLGVAYLELDRRDAARRALRQSLEIDPRGAARAHVHLANLYAREQQYRQAADELGIYLDATPTEPNREAMRKIEARWRALAKDK